MGRGQGICLIFSLAIIHAPCPDARTAAGSGPMTEIRGNRKSSGMSYRGPLTPVPRLLSPFGGRSNGRKTLCLFTLVCGDAVHQTSCQQFSQDFFKDKHDVLLLDHGVHATTFRAGSYEEFRLPFLTITKAQ